MINIRNNLNEMFEFANNDLDGGEDLEDGEIFDDEAEPEEKTEAPAKVEIQKNSSTTPSANTAAPVAKAVLKNDAYNVHDKTEKKNDKFSNNRWTDENSKKEEKNSGHFDGEKRFKEKKMKRKKPKEEDSENDGPAKFKGKKRKTSFERELEKLEDSDYIDEDDEEMLNIRGASPSRWLDIFSDEEDQSFDVSEGGRGGGGGGRENMRGGAARRRGVGFRGGRIDRNARRERIERMNSRGKRRGKGAGMRGGKKRADEKEICIYHMQGKCHRGNECPFSHDAMPPRKMELCKFYLMDCCAKKDKCLYMHSEFPCKYFHTGLKCFAGKNCKFSHGKLTDNLRAILNKTYGPSGIATNELTSKHQEETGFQRQHLETAPKEILGDFPRLREATRNLKKDMKIPSLFDIKVSPPRDMRSQSDSDGNHTPMPSPTHQPNNKEFFRESMEREHTPPSAVERRRGEHHHKTDRSGKTHSQRKEARRSERAERAERLERTDRFEEGGSRSSRERRDKAGGRRSSRDDEQHHDARLGSHANNSSGATGQLMNNNSRRQASYSPPPNYEEEPPVNERLKAPEPDQSSNDFLSHLPKKQRELFIRIQQQQRQAENSQESNPEDEDEDKDYKQEENWYSSDEESTPLTTILKTINIQKTSSMAASTTSSQSPNQNQHQQRHHHHHHHHQQSHTQVSEDHQQQSPTSSSSALPVSIPDIDFGDVSALLSKVKQHIQTTADKLKVRDPRLRSDQEPSEKQQHHSVSSSSEHAHNEPHAPAHARNAHAPGQLSPSISAILNSATASTRHQQHNHHHHHHSSRSSPSHSSSHHSFPPPTPSLNSRSSPSHHHSSSFPPPTPSLNFDDDEDGISSPDADDMSADENMSLSSLPFKPAPVHSAANEIDASINSHAPIVYRLVPLVPSKPDYSALQTMPKGGALDPRWRKAVRFNEESGLASRRDPRHRLADDTPRPAPSSSSSSSSTTHAPADPRQRLSAMMNNNSTGNSLLPPPTPRYDDDHAPLNVAGMRTSNFPAQMDVSAAMFCPPTPRMDDEPPASLQPPQQQQQQQMMSANIRPTDPRQRQHMMNNMNQQQQAMPSIGNMYDQIRQQQMQFMPNQQSMMYDPSRGMYGNDMSANINRQPQYNNYK